MDKQDSFLVRRIRTQWNSTHKPTLFFIIALAFILGISLSQKVDSPESPPLQASLSTIEKVELGAFPIKIPTIRYGFAIDTFQVVEDKIRSGQFLADILLKYKMNYLAIEELVENAQGTFDVRHFQVGKKYTILTKDTAQTADYFIYEPNVYAYYIFELQGNRKVTKVERPIEKKVRISAGQIESSLWNAMIDNGLTFDLAAKMEDALQWSVDFHHLQKGDQFRLVYDQNYIEGEQVGVGQVYAAHYKSLGTDFHAVYFDNGINQGYYDLEGRPMDKGFLKAPVKYSRISSGYNLRRFHPILKRVRPHLGTDYAAPYGTPIYAVGNGVVTNAGYGKGNGNYVKIKHDDTYQTQYLHMQKFAAGIRSGVQVKQGQVIGYVGSTGLATGPHVCFRFWKNGKQVNHLSLNFPPPAPLPETDLPAFYKVRDQYLKQLEQAVFQTNNNDLSEVSDNQKNIKQLN